MFDIYIIYITHHADSSQKYLEFLEEMLLQLWYFKKNLEWVKFKYL